MRGAWLRARRSESAPRAGILFSFIILLFAPVLNSFAGALYDLGKVVWNAGHCLTERCASAGTPSASLRAGISECARPHTTLSPYSLSWWLHVRNFLWVRKSNSEDGRIGREGVMSRVSVRMVAMVLTVLTVTVACQAGGGASAAVPAPAVDETKAAAKGKETAVVAGGCFWGIQAVFQHVKGVLTATSGYAGGTVKHPDYEMVSSGRTGHAESVEIVYDPSTGYLWRVAAGVLFGGA